VCECVCKCSATPFCLERKKEATILFIGVQLFKLPISGRHTFTVFSLLNYEQKGQLTGLICQKKSRPPPSGLHPPVLPFIFVRFNQRKSQEMSIIDALTSPHTHKHMRAYQRKGKESLQERESGERRKRAACSRPINH